MKLGAFINELTKDFFIIFGSTIIIITILRQFFYPDLAFDLKSIYTIMAFSLIGTLPGFILYSSDEVSERSMRIRIVIHFIALEVIMLSLAGIIGVADSLWSVLLLAAQIAVIYVIVRLLSWQNDRRAAEEINKKLSALRKLE